MQRSVTKVKYRQGGKVEVHLTAFDEEARETELVVKSDDAPEPELGELFGKLAPFVGEICEADQLSDDTIVVGVSWAYEDGGNWGVVMTALRNLTYSNSPMVINTPYKRADDKAGAEYSLPMGSIEVLAKLAEAALRYIDGHRAQMALSLEEAA